MTLAALFPDRDAEYRILAVGAHPDDVEIGAGGTLLRFLAERLGLRVDVLVLTGDADRHAEADASARALLGDRLGPGGIRLVDLRDGFLPAAGPRPKEELERCKASGPYDAILSPSLGDAHQDHRLTAELVWQTFRSVPILEYEIPKYEGITERPNLFVELDRGTCERKVAHLMEAFPSQRDRSWFDPETFWAMLRLRGVESAAASGYAEGFVCRKLRI
jgi:LmbE family N-acetylglucosaminyl deacetylase